MIQWHMLGILKSSVPILRIHGIPVEINYSWILIFLLVSVNLATGWFPATLSDKPSWMHYLLGIAGSVSLFVCVLIHELSHSLVALRLGLKVDSIVLHVFGGVSLIREEHYTPGREFKVTIAGPLSSILLAAVFLAARSLMPDGLVRSLLTFLFFVNLLLALFNLLPGFPLDGGRLLRSAIAWRRKDYVAATRISSQVGVALALVLMVYGAIAIFRGNYSGLWTVLIGLFLKEAADSSYKRVIMESVFRRGRVSEIMQRNPVVVPPDITVQEAVDAYFWRYDYGSFPVGREGRPLGILAFNDVKKTDASSRTRLAVEAVMHPADESLLIRPDDSLLLAMEKLSHNGVARLIVVDEQGAIRGYLSLRDVAHAFRKLQPGEKRSYFLPIS